MQFLQKEWVENQPTPTFDKEPKFMVGVVLGLHRLFFTTFIYKCSLILYNKSVNVGGDV